MSIPDAHNPNSPSAGCSPWIEAGASWAHTHFQVLRLKHHPSLPLSKSQGWKDSGVTTGSPEAHMQILKTVDHSQVSFCQDTNTVQPFHSAGLTGVGTRAGKGEGLKGRGRQRNMAAHRAQLPLIPHFCSIVRFAPLLAPLLFISSDSHC